MDESKRVIVEQDDDVKVIVKPSAASKKLTVDDEHEMGLSWDEQGVHFRVDETDDLPVAKAIDTDTVDGKHASDLQNYNNLTNKPDLKKVATTGSYNDLEDKPEFLKVQVQADWNETNKRSKAYIKNKPTSFSSDGGDADTVDGKHASDLQDYNNLTNKPDIPVVAGNAKNAIRLKDGKSDYQMGEGAAALSPSAAARGNFSFAEGSNTYTFGDNAHAEGFGTIATSSSHAEGYLTIANGISTIMTVEEYSENVVTLGNRYERFRDEFITEFFENAVIGSQLAFANSQTEGYENLFIAAITAIDKENRQITLDKALDAESEYRYACPVTANEFMEYYTAHAEGIDALATGMASHAEGADSTASGYASHSEGYGTIATGDSSHAEGELTIANEYTSHAEGKESIASGEAAHAEGELTIASGKASHAEGFVTITEGTATHAEGHNTIATTLYTVMQIKSIEAADNGTVITIETEDTIFDKEKIDAFFEQAEPEDKLDMINEYSDFILSLKATIVSADKEAYTITIKETIGESEKTKIKYIYPVEKASNTLESAHAEGEHTIATGGASHAEGAYCVSSGYVSHAEGNQTQAVGSSSHAEGNQTKATGIYSHAEGSSTKAEGENSHAQGWLTVASAQCAHAEGFQSKAIGNISHSEGSSIASGAVSHAEGKQTQAIGNNSHTEGEGTKAEGNNAHTEGKQTQAKGENAHAEGNQTKAEGKNTHAEGMYTLSYGASSHVEGHDCIALGKNTHAEGVETVAADNGGMYITAIDKAAKTIIVSNENDTIFSQSHVNAFFGKAQQGDMLVVKGESFVACLTINSINKENHTIVMNQDLQDWMLNGYVYYSSGKEEASLNEVSHAEGYLTVSTGKASHAEGHSTIAAGDVSHAEGGQVAAKGLYSHAEGYFTVADDYQHAGGKFNIETAGGKYETTEGSAFIIGNGTSKEARSNCFRVQFDGKVFSQGEYATTGADYAELFEWEDKNEQAQDRRGLFVALKGTKIHIADSTDKNIIGIISSKPAMVGNNYSETWKDMYLTDLWGDVITQRKTIPAKYETIKNVVFEKDENGEEKQVVKEEQILVSEAYEADVPVLNPDYNKEAVYIPRHKRKEWGIVGMLGQLIVEDDGSCEAGGYCKCADGGIATKAESGYYIMERIDASHIRVLFK